MEKEIDLQELKQNNAELIKKACIYTNLSYALIEVADSFMVDTNSMLNSVGAEISKTERQKLKNIRLTCRNLKVWLHDFARQIYDLDIADDVLADTDNLYDIIYLIMDRCGGKVDKLNNMKDLIYNTFKSDYGYYKESRE